MKYRPIIDSAGSLRNGSFKILKYYIFVLAIISYVYLFSYV